jgi:hypothetical protein
MQGQQGQEFFCMALKVVENEEDCKRFINPWSMVFPPIRQNTGSRGVGGASPMASRQNRSTRCS